MGSETEAKNDSAQTTTNAAPAAAQPPKPNNPAAVKKAIALDKEIRKQADKTKADAAREMYALIAGESRDIIVQAFIEGAGLTPKGAQTYYYDSTAARYGGASTKAIGAERTPARNKIVCFQYRKLLDSYF